MSEEGTQATGPIASPPPKGSQAPLDPSLAAFLTGLIAPGRATRVLLCGNVRDTAPLAQLCLPGVEWTRAGLTEGQGELVLSAGRPVAADDGAFDIALAVNLATGSAPELPALLSELWRVSGSLVLHLEAPGSARRLDDAWATVHPLPVQHWPSIAGLELSRSPTPARRRST